MEVNRRTRRLLRQEFLRRKRTVRERKRKQRSPTQQISTSYNIVKAPRRMSWAHDEFADTIGFLAELRREALEGDQSIFLDMRECQKLSGPCCLLLAAEIERCNTIRPGSIRGGAAPLHPQARWLLTAYGLNKVLGFRGTSTVYRSDNILEIVAGGDPNVEAINPGELTYRVAEVAESAFGDSAFSDRVHSALNEATDNVIGHAYDPDLITPDTCVPGRWWVSGISNPAKRRAFFFVLDHGATIPGTAPKTLGEGLWAVLGKLGITKAEAVDHHLLRATVHERRTQTLQKERGKGLSHMISLIDDVKSGSILIYSGAGYYMFTRRDADREPLEGSGSLPFRFPGTLIVWEVNGGANDIEELRGNGDRDQNS